MKVRIIVEGDLWTGMIGDVKATYSDGLSVWVPGGYGRDDAAFFLWSEVEQIQPAHQEFGIGRLAADTDQTAEILADIEAEEKAGKLPTALPGDHIAPAGTTEGICTGERCEICGQPGNWNPNAGQTLCARHWDEY
jgi:hypothetical protein